jgi:hypothetical protein
LAKNQISFANLSVRFGEKELLDYKEIVTRAFLNDTNIRSYGKTSYFFFETEMYWANENDPLSLVIAGRFVKDTVLTREQILKDSDLVLDHQSIRSSPSAFFVFFLADHRLAYMPETANPPTLSNFEATIERFIKDEFARFLKEWRDAQREKIPNYTWNMAYRDHVPPAVNLVPLTSKDSIAQFVAKFSKINALTVHLIERNQDIDGGNLFERLTKKSEPLEPTSAKFVVQAGKDGLEIDETKGFVQETTEGGYERVALRGEDQNGAELKGSNDEFNLRIDLDAADLSKVQKVEAIYESYVAQKNAGNIVVTPRAVDEVAPILREIFDEDE